MSFVLKKAYSSRILISIKKYNDLSKMCDKGILEKDWDYYKNLPCVEDSESDIMKKTD